MSTESRPQVDLQVESTSPIGPVPVATPVTAPGGAPAGAVVSPDDGALADPSLGRFGIPKSLLAALLLANFGTWFAFFTPVITTIPLKVKQISPDHPATTLSLILSISAIFGLIANPIAGHLSDRSSSRFGRRRPWIFGSAVVGLAGLLLMAFAPDVAVFVIGSVVGQIGFAGVLATLLSLLPDYVPAAKRASVGGLLGVTQAFATVCGVVVGGALSSNPHAAFTVVGVIGVAAISVICLVLRETPLRAGERPPLRIGAIFAAFYVNPRKNPDFAWAWVSRFAVFMGFSGVTNYQLYYLINQLHISAHEAAAVYVPIGVVTQVLSFIAGSVISGALSDRVGRRKPFVLGAAALGVVGLSVLALATTIPMYVAAFILLGVATGSYSAVDLALVSAVLPGGTKDSAKDIGVLNIANQLPQTLAPAFAPVLLSISFWSIVDHTNGQNYTMFFLGSAIFALISALTVLKIKGVR